MSDKEKKPRKSPEKVALSPDEPKKAKKEKRDKKDKPEKAAKLEALNAEAAPKKKKKDAVLPEPIGEITALEKTPEIAATEKTPPTHWDISERAYQYFVERGYQDGFHEEDWLRAERDLQENL